MVVGLKASCQTKNMHNLKCKPTLKHKDDTVTSRIYSELEPFINRLPLKALCQFKDPINKQINIGRFSCTIEDRG